MKVVSREAMDRLRKRQALDLAIDAVQWDLDRGGRSFSETMSMTAHLQRLRAMRDELGNDEGREREEESAVD